VLEIIFLNFENRNQTLGFNNSSSAIQTRYFLLNEIISLFDSNGTQVGATVLNQPFTTIRFDGQRWSY
jgi:hypothetical protein